MGIESTSLCLSQLIFMSLHFSFFHQVFVITFDGVDFFPQLFPEIAGLYRVLYCDAPI